MSAGKRVTVVFLFLCLREGGKMQFVHWEFGVKLKKMQRLPKSIHFTVRKDAVLAKPSPCTAQTWQGQQHRLHQAPCCLAQAEGRGGSCSGGGG